MDTIKLSERRTDRDTKVNISLPDESAKCLSTLTKKHSVRFKLYPRASFTLCVRCFF